MELIPAMYILLPANSAYDDTVPWIPVLISFLDGLIKNHPKVRICGQFPHTSRILYPSLKYLFEGICFGHQILGRVLGGECVHSGKWEIGPTSVELTDLGRSIFGTERLVSLHIISIETVV